MLSCICLGIGEALVITAIAGSAGIAVRKAAPVSPLTPANDPACCNHAHVTPTCCNHVHVVPEPPPPRLNLESATRVSAFIALFLVAAFAVATCAGVVVDHRHHETEPCDHAHTDDAHLHV